MTMMMNLIQTIQLMTNSEFVAMLKKEGACSDSIAWCQQHGGTPGEMWRDCQRGDWLGWIIRRNARLLYVTDRQWAECLADVIAPEPKYDVLKKYLRDFAEGRVTHDEVMYAGYQFGLTKDFGFPQGKWPFKADAAEIIKQQFPLFGEQP